jgi:hypothetical protein
MGNLKRLSLLTTLALAAVALTAVSASADIEQSSNPGVPFVGPVQGHNVGPNPTLETSTVTITCTEATTAGSIDGDWDETGPATGSLRFAWDGCTAAAGLQTCEVDPVDPTDVNITEENAPDSTITNTERGETFIDCTGGVFTCTAWADPADGTEVEADVDSATQIASIDDTVGVGLTGEVGCPDSGQWVAQYQVSEPQSDPPSPETDPIGNSLGLLATGSQ